MNDLPVRAGTIYLNWIPIKCVVFHCLGTYFSASLGQPSPCGMSNMKAQQGMTPRSCTMTTVQEEESIFLEGSHLDHQVRGHYWQWRCYFGDLVRPFLLNFKDCFQLHSSLVFCESVRWMAINILLLYRGLKQESHTFLQLQETSMSHFYRAKSI